MILTLIIWKVNLSYSRKANGNRYLEVLRTLAPSQKLVVPVISKKIEKKCVCTTD